MPESLIYVSRNAPGSPDEQLDAAVASVLGIREPGPATPVRPLGRSWKLTEEGRLARNAAGQPIVVDGVGALTSWIVTSLTVARGAHKSVPPRIGMPDPLGPLGRHDARESASDWAEQMRRALLQHDRIDAVTDIEVEVDLDGGAVVVSFTALLDDTTNVGLSLSLPLSYLFGD